MSSPRRTSRALALCAIGIWSLWLLNLAAMAWYYHYRATHPSYLLVLGTLALFAVAGVVLLLSSLVQLVRKGDRTRAIGWLLVGITPILLAAAHLGTGAWIMFRDHSLPNLPVKLAGAAAASAADLVGRYRHPVRTSGDHVVLYHDAADEASRELSLLDEHILRMETLLGKQPAGTAQLFRGPVFQPSGAGGWYVCGISVVEQPAPNIGSVDRHELAHALIDWHCGSSARPPAILVEGWAESQSGYDAGFLAGRAMQRRLESGRLTLRAMTSPGWYESADWHCYQYGGPLVDYLLRTYGGPKFLELYSTCHPDTFAADVSRVFGLTLDELDARYWEDIAEQVSKASDGLAELLAKAPLADGIDPAEWKQTAGQFAVATEQPEVETGPVIIERELSRTRDSETADPTIEHSEVIHAGDRHRWKWNSDGVEQIALFTPDLSCLLAKKAGAPEWSLDEWKSTGRRPGDFWETPMAWSGSGDSREYLRRLLSDGLSLYNRKRFRVIHLQHDATQPERSTSVGFEYSFPMNDGSCNVAARFTMLPGRRWAVATSEVQRTLSEGTTVERATYEFPTDDPGSVRPVREEHRTTRPNQRDVVRKSRLVRHEPWAVDETAFDPEALGIARSRIEANYRTPWYFWCWGAIAPFTLLGGIGLLCWSRRSSTSEAPANDQQAAT